MKNLIIAFALLLPVLLPAVVPVADAQPSIGASVGGPKSPDGDEMQTELPGDKHQRNIASKGLGCCVFRSLDHAARYQNIPALVNFPEWMVSKGIPGGGYPSKVESLIPRIAKDRGLPEPVYMQIENSTDLELLHKALKSGRMVSITYSRSPTSRYGGSSIAHMVNVVHCDSTSKSGKKWVAVLDNNYIGENAYEWMEHSEFLNICNRGGFWAVILLEAPPPPIPHN